MNIVVSKDMDVGKHHPSGKKKIFITTLDHMKKLFSGGMENIWAEYRMRKNPRKRHEIEMKKSL
jgi:uncharacterized protein YifE (UPF0438 family)